MARSQIPSHRQTMHEHYKISCCKSCTFCARTFPKERNKFRVSSLLSPKRSQIKICERCFLCHSIVLCKTCNKCNNKLDKVSKHHKLLCRSPQESLPVGLFIYLGFYVAFNTVQVISRRVVGRAEETSTYSSLGFCTVNCRPTASNCQLSHLRPWRESNPGLRGGRRECYHSATVAPDILL